ncbi:type VII secretion protein EccB [Tessaracoccus bendigoensis DSM 12906]|uniref:Type VII secretion protein EccB n=1 Tax=Tessaracoccus bendigoensis DSM 12906 TaxID=1123357 RepID=A0A1M6DLB9_9ACTN|nr:type VII secretion protein EccB [Tessaracoccus bendigoensis]SHI74104.1 type VII secretion protein EccB [Tessaracoccus bendigoensis DSM 12906]
MATRKDLLKAQSFTSRRMIAAFVDRDPDDPTPPLRRVGTATFVSVLLGVVLLAGTTLLGLFRGGTSDDSWKTQQNAVIADADSGALFVYLDDKLFPMADVASARLKAAGPDAKEEPRVIEVKTAALQGVPQQPEFGIPGAPRQLPAATDLHDAPLRLCSSAPVRQNQRYLTLEFESTAASYDNFAIVAEHSNGSQYLVFGGKTHRLYSSTGGASSLVGDLQVFTPGDGWITALPAGDPIDPQPVDAYGSYGSERLTVGQMAVVEGDGNDRFYIQLAGGLSRIPYMEMRAIQQANNDDRQPVHLSEVEATNLQHPERQTFGSSDVPPDKPVAPPGAFNADKVSVCATFSADSPERATLAVDQATPEIPANAPAPEGQQVQLVDLPPLGGALLRNAKTVTEDSATTLLLNGKAYSIPSVSARNALGYGTVRPIAVTAGLLNLLPPGLTDAGSALSEEKIVATGN